MNDRIHELWECPPLRAWLSREQCTANRRWARGASIAKPHAAFGEHDDSVLRLRECTTCRGVKWWAKRTGSRTRSLSSAQLIASHVRDDLRRLQLGADGFGLRDMG
jgi:hypothetical protein